MCNIKRRKTRTVTVGKVKIGSKHPISVQSMCNTKTSDFNSTIAQIKKLEEAGCEIIRVSIPDRESVKTLKQIKNEINIPLVGDIHYDHKLAIASLSFVDKIRINPGTIGSKEKVLEIIKKAKDFQVPIRIGINSGSLEKEIMHKYKDTAQAMIQSVLDNIKLFEEKNFYDLIISLKSSNVLTTVKAHQLLANKVDYPFHIGITETGNYFSGIIKSSIGIGSLLQQGIGDTIRVSLTSDPIEEVKTGYEILKALKLRKKGLNIISCPTCARTGIDVIGIINALEALNIKKDLNIAVMGCTVNGIGESEKADIGIVGTKAKALLFKKGQLIKKIGKENIKNILVEEINSFI